MAYAVMYCGFTCEMLSSKTADISAVSPTTRSQRKLGRGQQKTEKDEWVEKGVQTLVGSLLDYAAPIHHVS